jgi:propanol-preferring alcohol dehydrogenase
VADVEIPVPAPGEIVIDVAACGVCRTDLQLVEGDLPAKRLPIVPGHQVVGRVRRSVTESSGGRRVIASASRGWPARAGLRRVARAPRTCVADAEFTGWDRDGGYADR